MASIKHGAPPAPAIPLPVPLLLAVPVAATSVSVALPLSLAPTVPVPLALSVPLPLPVPVTVAGTLLISVVVPGHSWLKRVSLTVRSYFPERPPARVLALSLMTLFRKRARRASSCCC